MIPKYSGPLPDWIKIYRNKATAPGRGAIHFFIDDYRFNSVWTKVELGLQRVRETGLAFSPDFSLYSDWSEDVLRRQIYKSRWCGEYWAANGVSVIPTVSWATEESFEYCFDGIEPGGVVALSAMGTRRDPVAQKLFYYGFQAMMESLEPQTILFYGDIPPEVQGYGNIVQYEKHWDTIGRVGHGHVSMRVDLLTDRSWKRIGNGRSRR